MKPNCSPQYATLLDHLDPAVICENFETIDEAAAESDVRSASLLRHGTNEARSLARDLKRCMRNGRCGLSICPLCWREARRELAAHTLDLLAPYEDLEMLHIVPEGAAFGECALRSFEPRRFRNSVRAVIARTGRLNGLLIGGVDLDFDATTRLLQPHIHAIIAGDRGGLTDAIRKSYQRRSRASPSVPRRVYRQVLVKEIGPTVEDRASAVTYTAKGYIREIRSYTGEKGRPRRSRPFRLSEPLHAEELLWRAHLSAAEFRLHMGVPRGPARSLRTACETACR